MDDRSKEEIEWEEKLREEVDLENRLNEEIERGRNTLYFGELLVSSLGDLKRIQRIPKYKHNNNGDCHCKDCISWFGDSYHTLIKHKLPFSEKTVILSDIESCHIILISRSWERCECQCCVKLRKIEEFIHDTKTKDLIMEDIETIKNKIKLFQCPTILPLCSPANLMIRRFELGSWMEIKANVNDRKLLLIIRTTSIDGMNIIYDPLHESVPKFPNFEFVLDKSDLNAEKPKSKAKKIVKKYVSSSYKINPMIPRYGTLSQAVSFHSEHGYAHSCAERCETAFSGV
jgi:hypothetical protein